ncbi:MAG TPA: sensor domain-containing diguanylate cyclase [Terriglobales bacterium]|jgi:diguanylate cyclase (GGDEF)-like protein|nr:sensor domain-containing diguanylate cyclase [Terriglobales bacterium]
MQKIAILYDASQAVLSTFDLDEVLQQILRIARDYFHLQNVAILMLDKEMGELYARCQVGWDEGHDQIRLPVGTGLTGAAAKQKRPVYAPDVSQDPRYVTSTKATRSELAIPLMVRDEVVGVLDCQSENLDHFDKETIDLLTLFSTQASMALQNAHLYSLERRRASQLEAINTVARQMTAVLDLKELLSKVGPLIQEAFHVSHVSVLLKEEEDLVLRAHHGSLTPRFPEGGYLPVGAGLWGRALATGKTLVENDTSQAPDYIAFYVESKARMCIPLVSFGQTLGVLALDSSQAGAFHEQDTQSLESVADICATAIQNAHYVERVKQLAYIDGLTGIFNRRFFELRINEEIERARRFGAGMAVIMVDIDQFKRLNDEFGHLLGDEVLRQVSSLFHQQLRKFDVVCRYGGEEFAILLSQTNPQHALAVAEKLRRLVETWQFPGVPRPVTISAGVATYPDHGSTRDELVKASDAGLYAAKQAGRDRVLLAPGMKRGAAQGAGE